MRFRIHPYLFDRKGQIPRLGTTLEAIGGKQVLLRLLLELLRPPLDGSLLSVRPPYTLSLFGKVVVAVVLRGVGVGVDDDVRPEVFIIQELKCI